MSATITLKHTMARSSGAASNFIQHCLMIASLFIVVGVVGAFISSWLLPQLGIAIGGGILGSIIHAMIGAVILLVIVMAIRKV